MGFYICDAQINWSYFENSVYYTTENGLPTPDVIDVSEDHKGFLWLATRNGVIHYDGTDFKYFDKYKADVDSYIGFVNNIKISKHHNRIFISSEKGLFVSDLDEIEFEKISSIEPQLTFDYQNCEGLYIEGPDVIWTGVLGEGLFRIDLKSYEIKNFKFKSDIANSTEPLLNSIFIIKADIQNNDILWLGSHEGLIKFNKESNSYKVYYFQNDPKRLLNRIMALDQSKTELYVGSFKEGWYIFDKSSEKTIQPIEKNSQYFQEYILEFYLESPNNLWITSPDGLVQFDPVSREIKKAQLNSNEIGITYIDSRGIIWFVRGNGLYKFKTDKYISHINLVEKESKDDVTIILSIIKIGDDYYVCPYFGEGIIKLDIESLEADVLAADPIPYREFGAYLFRDMVKTPENNLLVLGDNKLTLLNTKTGLSSEPSIQLPDTIMIYRGSIEVDKSNNYWIGTHTAGLLKLNFENQEFTSYQRQFEGINPRDHKFIKELFVDSDNNLWIGQAATSVMNLSTEEIRCLNPDLDYNPGQIFGTFYEDEGNRIWIANNMDGLGYVDKSNMDDGIIKMVDGKFTGAYAYNDSLLWTVKNGKLGVFNKNTSAHKEINFSVGTDITGPVLAMDDNEFMIGCLNGVLIYDPVEHFKNSIFPKSYIQEIWANNEQIYTGASLTKKSFILPSGTKSMNIEIGALSFHEADHISYSYKIDESWIDLKDSKEINLSNLKQGNYDLEIKLVNSLGQNLEPTKYDFRIMPFWYTSTLAQIIYFLLLGAFIYALYKFNLNRKLAIAESKRTKELDELKSKMFANVSHEFRTPLTVIQGLTAVLKDKIDQKDQSNLVLGIEQSNSQLLKLVNEMLDIASLDANKMTIDYKSADVVNFIRKCVDLFRSFSDSKLQTLEFVSEEDKLIMDFDDDKLQKILNNLLMNAIKFTPKNGKIKVTTKKIDNLFHIEVEDNGIGISEEDKPRIFDRFYSKSIESGSQGSGIGLSLTRQIVELMGGTITAESLPNRGSTFIVKLPINNLAEDKDITYCEPFIKTRPDIIGDETLKTAANIKGTILLVEDNLDIQNFIKLVLSTNYRIITSNNGLEGLEIAKKENIDFIISDLMMPIMDGFEFCQRIKSNLDTSHLPLIVISARTHTSDKQKAYKLGVDAYLTKPFNPEELQLIINNLLNKVFDQQNQFSQLLELKHPSTDSLNINKIDIDLMTKLQSLILGPESVKMSASNIARQLMISRTQLHRKIKSLTGQSLTQYANHLRIEKSKHLLMTTDLQIQEIAYNVGFESSNYFIRLFRKKIGVTPEEFRNSSH